jgi:mono/diheme cytochrome c family protein
LFTLRDADYIMNACKRAQELVSREKGVRARLNAELAKNLAKVMKVGRLAGVVAHNLPKVKKPSEGKMWGGVLIGLVLLVSLAACSVSVNDKVTPPGPTGVQTPLLSSPSPAQINLPFVPPDPASGAAIYQDKCAPCHGVSGKGDGVQAGNLASAPAPIGTAELARQARPVDWFSIIDTGHLAKYMPSTDRILTDRQRWDVLAYVLNLSVTLNEQTNGMVVYRQECQSCHGEKGRGDGPQAASLALKPLDWSDPSILAQKSLQDLFDATRQGDGQGMPAFSSVLDEGQMWSVVSYLRTLWYAQQSGPQTFSGATQPGVLATATPAAASQPTPTMDLSKTELTSDIAGLVADRLHVILEFTQPGVVQVSEVVIITNTQNKMVVPARTGAAVLNYDLPQGAANLQFQDGVLGDRYIKTSQGFGDTQSIPPGSGYQLVYGYDLLYNRQAAITLTMPVPVLQVVVMVPNDGVGLASSQLQFAGSRDVQGVSLQLFVGSNLAAGSPLQVHLTGIPQASPAGINANLNLLVGLTVFLLALVGSFFWYYRRQLRSAALIKRMRKTRWAGQRVDTLPVEETKESLLEAVVALDDLFREGKLAKDPYQARRNELVRALKEMRKSA